MVLEKIKGKVYSINLSKVKGIPKTAVDYAEVLEDFGLKDDAHAGDKVRQVSLLSIESIKKQRECIKKDSSGDLNPGDFAENITTSGLDLSELKIGDRLKIGMGVVLEISKIGKECHRFCAVYYRTGTCIMPREGIFAKVLKGGKIALNDDIELQQQSA